MVSCFMKFLKSLVIILITIIFFDLIINIILPENLKKRIGTSRNYSLKSEQFHHVAAPNINVYEFWGNKKYKIKTNKFSMRIKNNESFNIDKSKKNIGFVGDSFVYGSGIDYKDHFISNLKRYNYNFLNLGYVSYSPSIYFKKIEQMIKKKKISFEKIFLFIDHSDIQDEAQFYREDKYGNIVRKWMSDTEVKSKNRKYKFKNYLKQNSFIFKLYENISAPTISNDTKKCFKSENDLNFRKYLDTNRFGYSYINDIQNQNWVDEGINKTLFYLDEIKSLSIEYKFEIIIMNYPSALEVIDNVSSKNSKHHNFLRDWSLKNKVNFVDVRNDFIKKENISDYLSNFISCDVHWNSNGHKIISDNLNILINE